MTEETKQKLIAAGREDLINIHEINQSGYAGVLSNGNIVDRRKHPNAIPIQENSMFGTPKPKPLNIKNVEWETRQSTCCSEENNNTDSDICPYCKEHTGWEYLDKDGEVIFED